ncbi:hypothetical protein [Dokdonia sp. Asnod3-C12]|uniref:hypothetical protein n=1 Tax=Dokdonia sp. Asnod3-C12 TaxID=3160575 RepID=UPI00386320E9
MKFTPLFLLIVSLLVKTTYAQVGVGTVSPYAALDITSSNSGLLIPRVDLNSISDVTTVVNPNGPNLIEGTMVYNTGHGALTSKGFYFWQDSQWNQVARVNQSSVRFGKILIDGSGVINVTGVGFEPSSVEFTAVNRVQGFDEGTARSGTNNSNDIRMAGGMTTGYAINGASGMIDQQVISNAFSGSSINNIGTYASEDYCIAAYFVNNNGSPLSDNGTSGGSSGTSQEGFIRASLDSFDTDGFTINVDRFISAATGDRTNQIVVLYKAYR